MVGERERSNRRAVCAVSQPPTALLGKCWGSSIPGLNWPRLLSVFARRVNPLLGDPSLRSGQALLGGVTYYWGTDQAEYATDILFRDAATLARLYPQWLEHATLRFSAEDVMTFLGRKLTGQFAGELRSVTKRRWPGARVKHRLKAN